ncbi:MAG: hypothetical protein UMU76_05220 [Prosthecochloris sp.]|nr:hypothetical protein [Prosthecochloris sp.]MEC9486886.1 hypothetical protein [Prosthecochloris sp.]
MTGIEAVRGTECSGQSLKKNAFGRNFLPRFQEKVFGSVGGFFYIEGPLENGGCFLTVLTREDQQVSMTMSYEKKVEKVFGKMIEIA